MFVMLIGYFALFGIKLFAIGTALTIPLIIILVLFKRAVSSTFKRPMELLSLHAAADLDRADKVPLLLPRSTCQTCNYGLDIWALHMQCGIQHIFSLYPEMHRHITVCSRFAVLHALASTSGMR